MGKDTISFYVKVSSERNFDFFKFYLDGVEKSSISGSSSDWTQKKYVVTAGTHTLKFEYSKDYSNSTGQDAVWIDNLRLPLKGSVTGLNDIEVSNLSISPNPADKQIQISNLPEKGTLFVFDMNGKVMKQKDLNGSDTMLLNTEDIAVGTYTLCIKSRNNIMTKKFIIAK